MQMRVKARTCVGPLREDQVCQPVKEILKENKDDANDKIHQCCNQNFRPRDFAVLVDFLFPLEVASVVHPKHPLCDGLTRLSALVSFIIIILTYQTGKSSRNLIFCFIFCKSVFLRNNSLWEPLESLWLLLKVRL